jgi:hypothetical protein
MLNIYGLKAVSNKLNLVRVPSILMEEDAIDLITIIFVPLAMDEEEDKKTIFSPLAKHLASIFDALVTITDLLPLDRSQPLFDEQRNQLNSDKVLPWLSTTTMNNTRSYDKVNNSWHM